MFVFLYFIIGSTDAIAFCTTGNNDPITSALHIILGKWKRHFSVETINSKVGSYENWRLFK